MTAYKPRHCTCTYTCDKQLNLSHKYSTRQAFVQFHVIAKQHCRLYPSATLCHHKNKTRSMFSRRVVRMSQQPLYQSQSASQKQVPPRSALADHSPKSRSLGTIPFLYFYVYSCRGFTTNAFVILIFPPGLFVCTTLEGCVWLELFSSNQPSEDFLLKTAVTVSGLVKLLDTVRRSRCFFLRELE